MVLWLDSEAAAAAASTAHGQPRLYIVQGLSWNQGTRYLFFFFFFFFFFFLSLSLCLSLCVSVCVSTFPADIYDDLTADNPPAVGLEY